jgi:hypothetical protein
LVSERLLRKVIPLWFHSGKRKSFQTKGRTNLWEFMVSFQLPEHLIILFLTSELSLVTFSLDFLARVSPRVKVPGEKLFQILSSE